ncbi:transcription factor bHLH114 [Tanacetum coccineum]
MNEASSSSTFPKELADMIQEENVTFYTNNFRLKPELYNYYEQPDHRAVEVPLQFPLMMDYQSSGLLFYWNVIYDNVSRRSKGFGFVTVSSVEEVKEPVRKYSGHRVIKYGFFEKNQELDGREIWVNSGLPQRREESYFGGSREGFDSNEEEVVPKVDDVSLVDGVFDGIFGGDGEEDVVMGEVEAMEVRYEGDEDDKKSGDDGYLIYKEWIKENCSMSGSTFGGFSKTRGTSFVNELTKQVGEGVLAREVPSSFPSSSSSSLR